MVTFTMTGTPSDRSPPDGRTLLIVAVIGTLVGRDRTSATAFVGTSSSRATGSLMLVLKATGNPVVTSRIAPLTTNSGSDSHHETPASAPRPITTVDRQNAMANTSFPNGERRNRPISPPPTQFRRLVRAISTKRVRQEDELMTRAIRVAPVAGHVNGRSTT